MNAALKYLGTSDLRGKVFVSSGLGGMSGAQAKAGVIAGLIAVIAEVDGKKNTSSLSLSLFLFKSTEPSIVSLSFFVCLYCPERAITKRLQQGWVKEVYRDIDQVINRLRESRANKESTSIAYHVGL